MKAALLAIILVSGAVQAEAIECPAENSGARLIGAGIFEGDGKQYELMGEPKMVPGGHDVRFSFNGGEVRWIACWYEPTTARWYRVSLSAKHCVLKQRTLESRRVTASVKCK
jgi:hypothetical protein